MSDQQPVIAESIFDAMKLAKKGIKASSLDMAEGFYFPTTKAEK